MTKQIFARTAISLYIDDISLKVLVARGKQAKKWATATLEPGLVKDEVITDSEKVAEKIQELFRFLGIKPRKVIVGLSGLHSLSRTITLPWVPRNVLPEAVAREAERELPVSLENLYLSWQVIQSSFKGIKVLVVAYTRNVVDALVKTMRLAGIKPRVLELAPLALARAAKSPTAAVFDVRPSELDIVVMVDGVPELIRSLPFINDEPSADRLSIVKEELERTIQFYDFNRREGAAESALTIFDSGKLAGETGWYQTLSDSLGHPVVPLQPPLECPEQLAPELFMVNLGMALRGLETNGIAGMPVLDLNLLPVVHRPKGPPVARALIMLSGATAVATVVGLGMFLQNTTIFTSSLRADVVVAQNLVAQKQAQEQALKKEIADIEKKVVDSESYYMSLTAVAEKFAAGQETVNGDLHLITVAAASTDTVELKDVKYSRDAITVTGNAASEEQVLSYARALDAGKRFSEIAISSMNRTQDNLMDFGLLLKH